MRDFAKNEADNWQKEVRSKITDLSNSLLLSNHQWSEWEFEFIESIQEKLDGHIINVSSKQYEKIWDLWEKL